MTDYLVFSLYGSMVAWGDIAVGEVRPSFAHPSKSAILGLVAAALGIDRADEEAHKALANGYGFAVRVESMGVPLVDYHTAQVPPAAGGRRRRSFATRRDELTIVPRQDLATILSRRDYRMDAAATAVLWARTLEPPHSLATMAGALCEPRYVLYLGRKSCPIALPLNARVISADTVREALGRATPVSDALAALCAVLQADAGGSFRPMALYWDEDAAAGVEQQHTFERRDAPISRKRWQFDVRRECHGVLDDE